MNIIVKIKEKYKNWEDHKKIGDLDILDLHKVVLKERLAINELLVGSWEDGLFKDYMDMTNSEGWTITFPMEMFEVIA